MELLLWYLNFIYGFPIINTIIFSRDAKIEILITEDII